MFLDGSQPADARIVGEAFIVVGDDAVRLGLAEFFQRKITEMSIQEQKCSSSILLRIHHERFNQPHLFDGCADCLVSPDILLRVFYLAHWKNNGERKPDFPHLESNFCVTHAASLCLVPSLSHKYFGIVERDSALNRFTKFSSARS